MAWQERDSQFPSRQAKTGPDLNWPGSQPYSLAGATLPLGLLTTHIKNPGLWIRRQVEIC